MGLKMAGLKLAHENGAALPQHCTLHVPFKFHSVHHYVRVLLSGFGAKKRWTNVRISAVPVEIVVILDT